MKKHLYYYNYQLGVTLFSVVIDDIIQVDNNDKIYYLSCQGELIPCLMNEKGLKSICKKCRFNQNSMPNSVKKKLIYLKAKDFYKKDDIYQKFKDCNYKYNDVEEIKNIKYKGINIGYAALSSYISWTRNRDPVIDINFIEYFNMLLLQQVLLKEVIDKIIEIVQPDVMSVFNGRYADVRPLVDTAINNKILLRVIEQISDQPNNVRKDIYYNSLPHNIDLHTDRMKKMWDNSECCLEDKKLLANKFFKNQKGDNNNVNRFIVDQKLNLLPKNWDQNKKNIVIFNSSDDERAAISKEFESYSLFKRQEEGIEKIIQIIDDQNIHFYLRIHPNLKSVEYGYHKRLYQLEKKYSNITIIAPDSPISTYALIKSAEKVIVFGSTTGVEACYYGKAVILLEGSYYYNLNVAYIPKDLEELKFLILKKINPMDKIGAVKYAYYLMDYKQYTFPLKNAVKEIKIFGKLIGYNSPYLKFFGSTLLYKIYYSLRFIYFQKMYNLLFREKCLEIPLKGY